MLTRFYSQHLCHTSFSKSGIHEQFFLLSHHKLMLRCSNGAFKIFLTSRCHFHLVVLICTLGVRLYFNPLTPKISLVILLTACHTIYVMLVWRIWN